jgi:hypothetical protein
MNRLDRHTQGRGSWIKAVGMGIASFLLTLCLLTLALYYFLPGVSDRTSRLSILYEIAVVLVSIVVGISQVLHHRPRQ